MVDILEKYGGWPVIKGHNWKSDEWQWMEANKKIFNDGFPANLVMGFFVEINIRNSSTRIIYVRMFVLQIYKTNLNKKVRISFHY